MLNVENELKSVIPELLKSRKPGRHICPSEAARNVFGEDWRELMPKVREVANSMMKQNQIEICQ